MSPLLSCPFHLLYGISNVTPGNFVPERGSSTKFPQNVEVISKPFSNDNKGDAASPGMSRDRMPGAELVFKIDARKQQ